MNVPDVAVNPNPFPFHCHALIRNCELLIGMQPIMFVWLISCCWQTIDLHAVGKAIGKEKTLLLAVVVDMVDVWIIFPFSSYDNEGIHLA
ncbi:hypothetical protein [Pantoea sp. SGAir0215]